MPRKINYLEILGAIILFAGWMFAFLPHTAHLAVDNAIGITSELETAEKDESKHYAHVFVGVAIAVVGVIILVISEHPS